MQFTPQQLAGAQKYNCKTRVGNWFEDSCLDEARTIEFISQESSCKKLYDDKIKMCCQKILSDEQKTNDGVLRYGIPFALVHKETGGTLACDPYKVSSNNDSSNRDFEAMSVSRSNMPMARNMFTFVKVKTKDNNYNNTDDNDNNNDDGDDDIVRWGVPFQITPDNNIFMASCLKTQQWASPVSCQQPVYITKDQATFDTHWVAHTPAKSKHSGHYRLLSQGCPILLGESMVIEHCATKNLLTSSSKYDIFTDFYREYELVCKTSNSFGRVDILRNEFCGATTVNTNCRPDDIDTNVWSIGISNSNKENGGYLAVPQLSTNAILLKVKDILRRNDEFSLLRLVIDLKNCEKECYAVTTQGSLEQKKLHQIFYNHNILLDDNQFHILTKGDDHGKGLLQISKIINLLQESNVSSHRRAIIYNIYSHLEEKDILDSKYFVELKDNSELISLLLQWVDKDGKINEKEFTDFHNNVGFAIKDDDFFYTYVNSIWSNVIMHNVINSIQD